MVLNEAQLAKVSLEIILLKAEAETLEQQANSDDSMYNAAWREYGSELAGPPSSIILNRNTAKELRKKADFLESVERGEVDLNSMPKLKNELSEIDLEIKDLNVRKVNLYMQLSRLMYLAEIIKQ